MNEYFFLYFSKEMTDTISKYRLEPFSLSQKGTSKTLLIDVSSVTGIKSASFRNQTGTIAYTSDFSSGTWSASISNLVGFTGTASVDSAFFIRVGNKVMCSMKIRGLTTAGSTTQHTLDSSLPVSASGSFSGLDVASGICQMNVAAVSKPSDVGIVNSVDSTQTVKLDMYNNEVGTTQSVAITANFTYDTS